MSVIDLKTNRSLLDIKFEGYKLSLDPIPVLRQPVIDGIKASFYLTWLIMQIVIHSSVYCILNPK